ncbi:MAG: amino acid carrier protein [Verrucomicrobia bacterium]|nr:amino acid carrier protein [Verrucomicrobiota bacterium]
MAAVMDIIASINKVLWHECTLYLLLVAGVLFTIWTKFVQFRILGHGVAVTRGVYDNPKDPGAINHFQALSAALSATIGLGNIGGVALAVAIGGPGAVFWMWVVGFLGMALKTVEITLAMMYRDTSDADDPHGGAMWVIDKTLGAKGGIWKVLAKAIGGLFCVTLLIMTMAGGNMFQTWNVADLTLSYFGVPKIATGIILSILVGMVIIGGIRRIGHVAARLVPVMCMLYILAGLAVLAVNITQIPGMLKLIFTSAFTGTEASGAFLGGTLGIVFKVGMQRALFSNEAGLGSAPIAHAAAKTSEPAREGVVGGLGPFIDTICICTLTALVILSTGTWNRESLGPMTGVVKMSQNSDATTLQAPTAISALPILPDGEKWIPGTKVFLVVEGLDSTTGQMSRQKLFGVIAAGDRGYAKSINWEAPPEQARWIKDDTGSPMTGVYRDYAGATLTAHAFDLAFPGLGKWLVTLASWMFAVSTMISWSYYGEQGVVYLVGKRGILPYKFLFLVLAVVGAVIVTSNVQLGHLADFGTGWMLWANMIIVLLMGRLAVRKLADYFERLDKGEFHPHNAPKLTDMVRE